MSFPNKAVANILNEYIRTTVLWSGISRKQCAYVDTSDVTKPSTYSRSNITEDKVNAVPQLVIHLQTEHEKVPTVYHRARDISPLHCERGGLDNSTGNRDRLSLFNRQVKSYNYSSILWLCRIAQVLFLLTSESWCQRDVNAWMVERSYNVLNDY